MKYLKTICSENNIELKAKLALLLLLTFFFSSAFASNEEKAYELHCAKLAIKIASNSLKIAETKRGSLEYMENTKLRRLGIKPIAEIFPTKILSRSYDSAYMEYQKKISKYQKSGKAFDELIKLSTSFAERSIQIIKKDSPAFLKECLEYTTRIDKNCNKYSNNKKVLQSCISYESKGKIQKMNSHFVVNSFLEDINRAKDIESKILKAIENDNTNEIFKLISKRLDLPGINLKAVMPKVYRKIVESKAKNSFIIIKNSSVQDRKEAYSQFKNANYLLKLAIKHKSNDQLKFFLGDKAYPLSRIELNKIKEYARNQKNEHANEILKKVKI